MTYAYDKVYLEKARVCLGRMLDFAVNDLKYDIDTIFSLFIHSKLAERFARGDFEILVGMSGVELAYQLLELSGLEVKRIKTRFCAERSAEYWAGWALTYYQWETGMDFKVISQFISIKEILSLYSPYHEMDIRQFVDKLNDIYRQSNKETKLKMMRKRVGFTQKELAKLSNVPIRTIQQYEQKQKNINKAQVEYLAGLSNVLFCDIEDLMERY